MLSVEKIEKFRIKSGQLGSDKSFGNNGAFAYILHAQTYKKIPATIIVSDGMGWEHVSISLKDRTPTWEEMCAIKDLLWDEEDLVVQYHPPKSEYVNVAVNCLHLWRQFEGEFPAPPSLLVGKK